MANIEIIKQLLPSIYDWVSRPSLWDSLIINRRKPVTYRVFSQFGNWRICLHYFEPCSAEECFIHPHAWPASFLILDGGYIQNIGWSDNLNVVPNMFYKEYVTRGSLYEMTNPRIWHSVQPTQPTFSIMVNGPNYEQSHKAVLTTKGKDLDKMDDDALQGHLNQFRLLIGSYAFYNNIKLS